MGGTLGSVRSGRSPYPAYNLGGGDGWGDGGERRSYVPLNNLECCDTDRCVAALLDDLRQVVEVFYLRTCTVDQACADCGCSERTLYRRLNDAHVEIMGYLNDISAGIALPCHRREASGLNAVLQV